MSTLKGTQKEFKARLNKYIADKGYSPAMLTIKFFKEPFSLIITCNHFECFALRSTVKTFIASEYGYLEEDQNWTFEGTASISYR